LHRRAEIAAHHAAFLFELGQHFLDQIGGDGEADADIAAGLAEDRRVDADHFAAHVDQRAAGITRIDRGVGLNEIVIGPGADLTPLRADDARRHRVIEAEGIADGHDPFADLEPVGVTEADHGEIVSRVDLDHGDIGLLIAANHFGVVALSVRQGHGDFLRAVDDVAIGENRAVAIDDESRADAGEPLLPARQPSAKEPAPELRHRVVIAERERHALRGSAHLHRRHVHHRRTDLFGQSAKVGHALGCSRRAGCDRWSFGGCVILFDGPAHAGTDQKTKGADDEQRRYADIPLVTALNHPILLLGHRRAPHVAMRPTAGRPFFCA